MSRRNLTIHVFICSAVLAFGCKDEAKPKTEAPTTPVEQTETPKKLDAQELGVESPRAFGYVWGKGSKAFKRAEGLMKAEGRDWKAIAEACEEAIAADKNHLAAHRLLGIALANSGESEKASEHFSTALAGDWLRWGPGLEGDPALTEYLKTPAGKGLVALNEAYKTRFFELAEAAVMVVAKRTSWKRPKKTGKQWAATRAELFAYHLDEERYLRITHTGESVVGAVASPSGDRFAVLAISHYEFPEDGKGAAPIASARVVVHDAKTFEQIGKSARLKKAAPSLALFFGAGEELLLDAGNRVYSVDAEGGKLKKSSARGVGDLASLESSTKRNREVLFANSEIGRVFRPWGVDVDQTKASFVAGEAKTNIALPDGGGTSLSEVALSPDGARVVFVGIGDPCQKDHQSAVYVADTKTGALKHVHRGAGLGEARWLDDNRFIYQSEPGELRVYDAASNDTTHTIKNRSGIALSAASNVASGARCTNPAVTEPPEPAPSGSEGPEPQPEPQPTP